MNKIKGITIKGLSIIALFFVLNNFASAQDTFETINGNVTYCRIVQIDSTTITYSLNDSIPNKTINLNELVNYEYNGEKTILKKPLQKVSSEIAKPKEIYIKKNSKQFADSIENLNSYFVYTYTGRIITGKIIEIKYPFLNEPYIMVDDKKIQLGIVKFYRNETGFFANTKILSPSGRNDFVQRIRKGEINLFEKVSVGQHAGFHSTGPQGGGMFIGGSTYKRTYNYYNIGFEDVKKTTYKNLYPDISSNPESLILLNKIKSNTDAQTTLYVIGGVLATVGFATLVHKTKDWDGESLPKPNVTLPLISIGSGVALGGIGGLLSNQKPKLLREAIDVYNK